MSELCRCDDGMCAHCEHIEDWRQGKRGDPSCPNCNGHGWYADGDALAGVQWPQTCDCVGQSLPQCVDDRDDDEPLARLTAKDLAA